MTCRTLSVLRMLGLTALIMAARLGACEAAEEPITLRSLLLDMLNRDAVARLPRPAYTCRQFSSYDRKATAPDSRQTWFANQDWSQFIRSESIQGRTEWVMMDAEGPGAVVRVWGGGPKLIGTLRVYLDGADKPVVEAPAHEVIGGTALVGPPFSAVRARGTNLYLPIPYAKRCKITYDRPNWHRTKNNADRIWYNINYRTYPKGTSVRTFTRADLDAARPLIERVGKALLAPSAAVRDDGSEPAHPSERVGSGESLAVSFKGPGAIRKLTVQIDADDRRAALRSTVLIMECDGQRTVWCPVGDFFGSGVGLNPFQGWWRVVKKSGEMTCFWVMPYQKSCTVALKNLGTKDITASLLVRPTRWKWDDRSMHFHTTWRHQFPIATQPRSDWNYVEVSGRGVFVGDTLAVMNPVPTWWGEGDEKIWVDAETFPSHFGTGTEDYYGYAWGNPAFFDSPFHAQPHVDGPGTLGHTTVTRTRILDAIPFAKSFRLDMEVWHWRSCNVAYAATAYWYARPGATSNRRPAPDEATRPIPGPPPPRRVKGALEGERLKITEKTGGVTEIQRIARHNWSGNAQLWWRDGKPGDRLTLALPVKTAGKYQIVVNLTKAVDYGIVQFHLDDEELGKPTDLYNNGVVTTGPIALGSRELAAGNHKLTVEITGAHPKAVKRHMFGLDYVKLEAAK